METFSAISMLFIIGGSVGYLLELFYRRIRHGKWINPGFLVGPFLPLYGVGTLLLYGICELGRTAFPDTVWGQILLLLLITFAMTAAELVTGLIFSEGLKVRLWDYSALWGNFRGIICPLFSLIWGLVGAFYLYVLHTPLTHAVAWLRENPFDTFFVGLFFGIFLVDFGYSSHVVANLRTFAKKSQSILGFEPLKVKMRILAAKNHLKAKFFLPFRNRNEVEDALTESGETANGEAVQPLGETGEGIQETVTDESSESARGK